MEITSDVVKTSEAPATELNSKYCSSLHVLIYIHEVFVVISGISVRLEVDRSVALVENWPNCEISVMSSVKSHLDDHGCTT